MITSKSIHFNKIIIWSGTHILWLLFGTTSVALLYKYNIIEVVIPWVPLSIIGTAVAFYLGFKNNQAYDRIWEARKVWGAIVNSSRTWGMDIDGFVSNQFSKSEKTEQEIIGIKRRLIYRHIAWLYTLREQLLIPTPWEHPSQTGYEGKFARLHRKTLGRGLVVEEAAEFNLKNYVHKNELEKLLNAKNRATQIIFEQSRDLKKLREENLIDDFRHLELTKILKDFYTHQGKCERIKKFPIPRQFANMSRYFVAIFILLLPFSIIPEIVEIGEFGIWLAIPITTLVGWIYVIMEIVGDYAEHPFQGLGTDIPMLSLCRTIEIDLRDMLSETEIPEPIKAKKNVLM